ncbi:MAG: hypothetical protein B6I24_00105 [Bacteroidetes bacterium 4572_128]|nr:MAG: hypothetical protein B6I24_00105 [Bacteroidetes bacterium 4572_128]
MDVLLHIDIIAQYFKNKLSVDIFNEEFILIKNFFEKNDDNFKIILTQNIIQNVKKSLKNHYASSSTLDFGNQAWTMTHNGLIQKKFSMNN